MELAANNLLAASYLVYFGSDNIYYVMYIRTWAVFTPWRKDNTEQLRCAINLGHQYLHAQYVSYINLYLKAHMLNVY